MLGAHNLFFMDETVVTLNMTPKYAWGTKRHPAEVLHAKGKTKTIGVYAGLGLVSDHWTNWPTAEESANVPKEHTDPRGNHLRQDQKGNWVRTSTPPRFMLYWWIRPPRRETTVLSRFIDKLDILDPNMTWHLPSKPVSFFNKEGHEENTETIDEFLKNWDLSAMDTNELERLLLLNNIEYRQVDDEGNLIQVATKNKKPSHIYASAEQMRNYLTALQELVSVTFKNTQKSSQNIRIPRYYFTPRGRELKGGPLDSERGDRTLFLRYLETHRDYVMNNFPPKVRENLVHAWDSAPQHGKTDVTRNTKSFIHDWVKEHLNIRGAVFLPVREPDYNPVELLFAFIKGVIRRRFPRDTGEVTVDEMVALIDAAFSEVSEEMIKGWLRYGCYRIPNDPDADKVCKTLRCGYEAHPPSILDLWKRVIRFWEGKHTISLSNDLKQKLMKLIEKGNMNDKMQIRKDVVSSFTKLHDVFAQSGDKLVEEVRWNHKGVVKKITRASDVNLLWTEVEPEDDFTVIYTDKSDANFTGYRKPEKAYKELNKYIVDLLDDEETGFQLLVTYTTELSESSTELTTAMIAFKKEYSAEEGLLSTLSMCKQNVDSLMLDYRKSDALLLPGPSDDIDFLLDLHERCYHAKLDNKIIIDNKRISSPTRLTPDLRVRLKQYPGPPRGKYKVVKISSNVEFYSFESGDTITQKNTRLYEEIKKDGSASDSASNNLR